MVAEVERQAIEDLWPKHLEHLPPAANKLGQPRTDVHQGIICTCGEVLGWPQDAPLPVMEATVVEHHYDAPVPPTIGEMVQDELDTMADGDPADEAQTTYRGRPVEDVHLPPAPDEAASSRQDSLPARRNDVVPGEDPLQSPITIIDPTLPYGPADVEHQLVHTAGRIERGMHFQRSWEEQLHYAKVAYELAYARALSKRAEDGPADVRKALALLDCEGQYLRLSVCETMVRAARECMHSLRSLQSGYQTVARSVGASMQNLPQRGP